MTTPVPADHPAGVLLNPDELHVYPHLYVEMCSGARPDGLTSLRSWSGEATVRDHATERPLNISVASMDVTVVNEFLGDPVFDLDALDADSMVLGAALWDGETRTEAFENITDGDWGPVVVVNSFVMAPDWRGTPLSPVVALRMLEVFAHAGLSAAALYAAPYNSDLPADERAAASIKIAAMWERAGFTRLHPDASRHSDNGRVMVRTLDPTEIANELESLAGSDPVLQAAIEQ